jgi:aminoglycoside phosphotransferase (APT) family kinase protein
VHEWLPGESASDLQPAWNVFERPARRTFLDALAVDDAALLRGQGWVLCQTLIALSYCWDTNPGIVGQARRALAAVLADQP